MLHDDEIVVAPSRTPRTANCRSARGDQRSTPARPRGPDRRRARAPLSVQEVDSGAPAAPSSSAALSKSHKGVNLPGGARAAIPSLTKKDLADLDVALELGVDFVALSLVRAGRRRARPRLPSATRARRARDREDREGRRGRRPSKRSSPSRTRRRSARRLGVEIRRPTGAALRSGSSRAALEVGKPVITATQMLESMIVHASRQAERRRRERDPRRHLGRDAPRRDRDGELPRFEAVADHGPDRARGGAVDLGYRHETPEASGEAPVGRANCDVTCDLAEALAARRSSSRRSAAAPPR